ncbi:hypothetical protein [Actinomadura rupiterrae]|uniref:hypothetical protein n=1 Tax=Actinomadura rupiterrae TaxID=559627 RepID=UPI0020A263D8|nr:hypothetical protein [Actinomadura rupiterrae]MCP2337328.1 hypothetical protein [Actinomadura rupiterrae]
MSVDLPRRCPGEALRREQHRRGLGNADSDRTAGPPGALGAGAARPLIADRGTTIRHLSRLGMHLASHGLRTEFDPVRPALTVACPDGSARIVVTGGLDPADGAAWFYTGTGTGSDVAPLARFGDYVAACEQLEERLAS